MLVISNKKPWSAISPRHTMVARSLSKRFPKKLYVSRFVNSKGARFVVCPSPSLFAALLCQLFCTTRKQLTPPRPGCAQVVPVICLEKLGATKECPKLHERYVLTKAGNINTKGFASLFLKTCEKKGRNTVVSIDCTFYNTRKKHVEFCSF